MCLKRGRLSAYTACHGAPTTVSGDRRFCWRVVPALAAAVLAAWSPAPAGAQEQRRPLRPGQETHIVIGPRTTRTGVTRTVPDTRQLRPRLERSDPFADPSFVIESGPVSFGEVRHDKVTELPGAVVVRVFSTRPWTLRLEPESPLTVVDSGTAVPVSRLQWRAARSSRFQPLQTAGGTEIARGPATTRGGELVVVDLELKLDDTDPTGEYGCRLRLDVQQR